MGKMKENPRYNVISCRVADDLRKRLDFTLDGRSIQEFVHSAVEDKLTAERHARLEELIRKESIHAD